MASSSIIHPNASHISIFSFDGGARRYTTVRRDGDKQDDDKKPDADRDEVSDADAKRDEKRPVKGRGRGDEDWWRRVPGIVAGGDTYVMREFSNLAAVRNAAPEIKAMSRAIAQASTQKPKIVLVAGHHGPLDAEDVLSMGDDLKQDDVDATIIVDHREPTNE